jgi:hypothetical protein
MRRPTVTRRLGQLAAAAIAVLVDVDRQRVVMDASYSPDASQTVRDELAAIVRTIEFVTP